MDHVPEAALVTAPSSSVPSRSKRGEDAGRASSKTWLFSACALAVGIATLAFLVYGQQLALDAPSFALTASIVVMLYALRQLFRVVYALGFDKAELWAQAVNAAGGVVSESRDEYRRVLRAIRQLDEDHELGKLADEDHGVLRDGLTLRAVELKRELAEAEGVAGGPLHPQLQAKLDGKVVDEPPEAHVPAALSCSACGGTNDGDARFCKSCGATIEDIEGDADQEAAN